MNPSFTSEVELSSSVGMLNIPLRRMVFLAYLDLMMVAKMQVPVKQWQRVLECGPCQTR